MEENGKKKSRWQRFLSLFKSKNDLPIGRTSSDSESANTVEEAEEVCRIDVDIVKAIMGLLKVKYPWFPAACSSQNISIGRIGWYDDILNTFDPDTEDLENELVPPNLYKTPGLLRQSEALVAAANINHEFKKPDVICVEEMFPRKLNKETIRSQSAARGVGAGADVPGAGGVGMDMNMRKSYCDDYIFRAEFKSPFYRVVLKQSIEAPSVSTTTKLTREPQYPIYRVIVTGLHVCKGTIYTKSVATNTTMAKLVAYLKAYCANLKAETMDEHNSTVVNVDELSDGGAWIKPVLRFKFYENCIEELADLGR